MSKDTLCWIGRYQADKTSGVPAPVLPLQQGPPLSPCSVGSFHHGHSDVAVAALPQSQEHHQVHFPRSPGTDRNLVHMLQILIAKGTMAYMVLFKFSTNFSVPESGRVAVESSLQSTPCHAVNAARGEIQ